jgi:phosphotransferase system enzyme I (PtsI)
MHMERIKGIAVSPGIIVGRAFLVGTAEQVVPHRTISESEIPGQLERLTKALAGAGAESARGSSSARSPRRSLSSTPGCCATARW